MATRTSWFGSPSIYDTVSPVRNLKVEKGKEVAHVQDSPKSEERKQQTHQNMQPGSATLASYKKAKDYLIAHGHRSQEVMDAPNTFHLRNYALRNGISLTAVTELQGAATEAERSARLAEELELSMQMAAAQAAWEADAAREAEAITLRAVLAAERLGSEVDHSSIDTAAIAAQWEAANRRELEATSRREALEMAKRAVSIAERETVTEAKQLAASTAAEAAAAAEAERKPLAGAELAAKTEAEREAQLASEASIRKADALTKAQEAEREASLARARAAEALAKAQEALHREQAVLVIQAYARSLLQARVYYKAWKSVMTLQKLHRGSKMKVKLSALCPACA